jgi:hypothetical protein
LEAPALDEGDKTFKPDQIQHSAQFCVTGELTVPRSLR